MPVTTLEGWINADVPAIHDAINTLRQRGTVVQHENILIHSAAVNSIRAGIDKILNAFHKQNSLKTGMPKEEVRAQLKIDQKIFNALTATMNNVVIDKDLMRLSSFKVSLSEVDKGIEAKILNMLEQSGFQPPLKEEIAKTLNLQQKQLDDILKLMAKQGSLVRVNETMYITKAVYEKAINALRNFFNKKKEMTVAEFRDILNTSRKYALPILEYLDTQRITMRVGDARKFLGKG